ncbi:MAG: hypothetical protein ACYCU7_09385 [Acidimicrobiales bacterium]
MTTAPVPTANRQLFAPLVARGLASLDPDDLAEGNLTLQLDLSTWLRRSGLDLTDAVQAMLDVRDALVDVGRLDARTEPVPLLAGDARTAVLSLAIYLDGLVRRAAGAAGLSRRSVVEQALDQLAA